MTTASPPEPLTLQHSEVIMYKHNPEELSGPAARLSV
jgi:hypothetical protein